MGDSSRIHMLAYSDKINKNTCVRVKKIQLRNWRFNEDSHGPFFYYEGHWTWRTNIPCFTVSTLKINIYMIVIRKHIVREINPVTFGWP